MNESTFKLFLTILYDAADVEVEYKISDWSMESLGILAICSHALKMLDIN